MARPRGFRSSPPPPMSCGRSKPSLSLAKIARRVELPRSTVHRIVTALEAESLVVPASPNGGYRLGPELARFAGQEERLAGMLLRTCAEVSATLRVNGHTGS
jgi:DNA-binding IclR family transcriptional regulator